MIIYCDGGSRGNPGPAGIGFIVKNNKGKTIFKKGEFIGKATNNVAEYTAVLASLKWLSKQPRPEDGQPMAETILFYLDSQLVVNQLKGLYKIKNSHLRLLIIQIKNLEAQLRFKINYCLIPREKNYEADLLVNQSLDIHLHL